MPNPLRNIPGIRLLRSRPVVLVVQAVLKWQRDECWEMGAALAYYALFSLFPIFLVILSLFGALLGPKTEIYHQIMLFAVNSLPPEAFNLVNDTLVHLNRNSVGAGIVSFLLLCFTASGVFGALTRSMNKIWRAYEGEGDRSGVRKALMKFLRNRLFGFLLVLSSGALILVSLISNIVIQIVLDVIENLSSAVSFVQIDDLLLLRTLQISTTYIILAGVIMSLYKVLPSVQIDWQDVWLGGLVTTGLLMLLQYLVSNSIITLGGHFRSYGVVGSVMILMLWIFLTCQIFFLGSEVTYVYAHLFGSRSGVQLSKRSCKVQH